METCPRQVVEGKIEDVKNRRLSMGAVKMAKWIHVLAVKLENLSSIPKIHMEEGKNQ